MMITNPKDFSETLQSDDSTHKKHTMITYSPNQKSNYLASQIINTVILNVEKKMDNEVNSQIISGLSKNFNEVPNSLDEINNGFQNLNSGTNALRNGSNKIVDGSNSLVSNYSKFDQGLKDIKNGSNTIYAGTQNLNSGLTTLQESLENIDLSGLGTLQYGISDLNQKEMAFNQGLQAYNNLVSFAITHPEYLEVSMHTLHTVNPDIPDEEAMLKAYLLTTANTLNTYSTEIANGVNTLNESVNGANSNIAGLKTKFQELQTGVNKLKEGSDTLKEGTDKLNSGINTIGESSTQILDGMNTVDKANQTINQGILTLDQSVFDAKTKLIKKTQDTKTDLKKIESLEGYSKEPLQVKTKEVNKVKSYGTAFSPLFICVGLWVGCLMLFMVLYYDKEERFGIFSIGDKRYVLKTFAYHGMITLSSIILAITLNAFLHFEITSQVLYYFSFILIGNVFMAIIEFLITNFKDIGKFIALILLILQLAASGGTFPIETVTKGFRWMNPYLPMTYAIKLLKECLIKAEGLKTQSITVLLILFFILLLLNIGRDLIKQKKEA